MKPCERCKIPKSLDAFHKLAAAPDGRKRVCKACRKEQEADRYARNREKIKARTSAHYYATYVRGLPSTDKQKAKEKAYGPRRNEVRRAKRQASPAYRLVTCLRARLGNVIAGHSKSAPTLELLGCDLEELRSHLEALWLPGMTWANHGFGDDKWHIDHKRPCASFDLTDPAQQRACFHYTNLQPLWQRDNISKGARHEGADHNKRNS